MHSLCKKHYKKSHPNFYSFLVFILILIIGFNKASASEAPADVKGAKTIDVEKANELYLSGAVFIDVREANSWQVGHIDGSVHLDFSAEEFVVLYASDALDKKTPIVFYCESPLVNSSAMASFFAAAWGYENVYYFRDGYYAWLAADYPIQTSTSSAYFTADNQSSEVHIP